MMEFSSGGAIHKYAKDMLLAVLTQRTSQRLSRTEQTAENYSSDQGTKMNNQYKKSGSDLEVPESVESVTAVATVSAKMSNEQPTDSLINQIEKELGGFDERVHYGGRIISEIEGNEISTVVTVNSVASHLPQSDSSRESNDHSDRVRVNSKITVDPSLTTEGLAIAYKRTKGVSDSIVWLRESDSSYSFLVKVQTTRENPVSFGCNGLTDRGSTKSGYLSESFENKLKVKQIPEEEVQEAVGDLSILLRKKWEQLD